MSLAAAGVDIILYCCGAYRAMNAAALKVYEAIRAEGTQKSVVPLMQSRADLYKYLDYHAYEKKLDELFAKGKELARLLFPAWPGAVSIGGVP
jgi:methylisocitrate lyase